MGWSNGGEIFDRVARGLIEAGADDGVVGAVCYELADALAEADWDTLDESIQEFQGHPVVQLALHKASGSIYLYGPDDGYECYIDYDRRDDEFVLHNVNGDTADMTAGGTVTGFNKLIDAWAERGGAQDYRKAAEEYRLA